jgi:chorismate dehydratase
MKSKKINGHLGEYIWVETQDGSSTLYSPYFDEHCHSLTGAAEETIYHYIQGCSVEELAQKFDPITILEIGFGTGLGLRSTLNCLKSKNVHFISTELDQQLVEEMLKEFFPAISFEQNEFGFSANEGQFKIDILIGNARKTVPAAFKRGLFGQVHAIFQDAFSPKRNPILWTYQWFQDLKEVSHPEVQMGTYSASKSIRKAMIKAGWKVRNVQGFKGKRAATRASLLGETSSEIIELLDRSPVQAFCDQDYTDLLL